MAIKFLRYPNVLLDLFNERPPYKPTISMRETLALYKRLGLSEARPFSSELE